MRDEAPVLYVLDANVLMEAHRRYYAFDLCPGFWECLEHYCGEGCVVSLDRVRDEVQDGDALADWVASAPEAFFVSTADPEVVRLYQDIMAWVHSQPQFLEAAKARFARGADGWLIAYAGARGATLVTHEKFESNAKRTVPMPNVCRQFGVAYCDAFAMLRALEVRFRWVAA